MTRRACVIGAGPNGLAAAIVVAKQGLHVEVLEAEAQPGGAVRTLELTIPGFRHDFGSAVYPLAVGSPLFSSLPLGRHGLEWIHSPCPLAHPFDDHTAITVERDFRVMDSVLGRDGKAWRRLMEPLARNWTEMAPDLLGPVSRIPRHPLRLARFGLSALLPATTLGERSFRQESTKALFAGLAAHSFLSLDEPLSAAFALVLGVAAHAVGWPVARGGAQSLTDALCKHLITLGGAIKTSTRVTSLDTLSNYDLTLCDLTPRQLLEIAGSRLSPGYKEKLRKFRYGPGVFKVDYALREPIPWSAGECSRAATVHLAGSAEEIVRSEHEVRHGRHSERPFVLLAQPSLFDSTRAPEGRHTAWAYCHVPNGSSFNMLERLESQIERFAPGFRHCVLARRISSPADLEKMDANLVGGDISGGAVHLRQLIFRPTWRHYETSAKNIYLCSSSTPPGGGVHGMCGYHAATRALARRSEK